MSELPKGLDGFVSAGHEALFQEVAATRCDVCEAALGDADDDEAAPGAHWSGEVGHHDAHAHMPSGRGLLVWARGDERRYQEPPLCPRCAAAIGMSALQRWEIEEEEG